MPEIELARYDSFRTSLYAIAYYALGRKKESDDALSQLIAKHGGNEYLIARVHAFRNQSDQPDRNQSRPASEKLAQRPTIRGLAEEAEHAA